MKKTPLTHASHKLSQGIFVGAMGLFLLVIVLTTVNFFTQGGVVRVLSQFDKNQITDEVVERNLVIGTAAAVTSMDPLNFEFQNRMWMNNVYEGLVALDASLQVKQALAVTFGQLDDLTWEFRLREDVKFHNGSTVSANDVMRSFKAAMEDANSQLKSVLSNISDITSKDGKIQITTKKPDPTFLNKLATVYIFRNVAEGERYGTGPYVPAQFEANEVVLTRFPDYWGALPEFSKVAYTYIKDKDNRMHAFKTGRVDILRNVPFQFVSDILESDALVITQPSLEVTFLGFGFGATDVFRDERMIDVLDAVIDKEELTTQFGSAVLPARQFVSNGVVGYAPHESGTDEGELSERDVQTLVAEIKGDMGKKKTVERGEEGQNSPPVQLSLTLDFSTGLSKVAKYIQSKLEAVGVEVILRPLDQRSLVEALGSGESQMYLLGWKSEFGDAIDFYKVLAHSRGGRLGEFNAGNYSDPEVDMLIAESDNTFDPLQRVKILQKIMGIILNENPMGIPLFETQIIYAVQENLQFIPRIDGYVNANEIR